MARAHVPKPTRRTACTHVSRAMQAARRREGFDFSRRLGRRAEAGPRRVLPRVRPPSSFRYSATAKKLLCVPMRSNPHSLFNAHSRTFWTVLHGTRPCCILHV